MDDSEVKLSEASLRRMEKAVIDVGTANQTVFSRNDEKPFTQAITRAESIVRELQTVVHAQTQNIEQDFSKVPAIVDSAFNRIINTEERFAAISEEITKNYVNLTAEEQKKLTKFAVQEIQKREKAEDTALKNALAEIKKYQQENLQMEKQATNAIEKSAKAAASVKISEAKRANEEQIKLLKQQINEEKQQSSGGGIASSILGGFAGGLGAGVVTALISELQQIPNYVISAGKSLLNLAKDASDYGREIGSAQTKTGLTVETLSALRYAAQLSNKEFSNLSHPLTIFADKLGDAKKNSVEAQKTLQALGVTKFDNLENALAQVFKRINDLPPGIEQMTAATDAFGKRAGVELLPIIAKMNGDLPEFTKRARELGLVMSRESVKSAKDFGIAYDTVSIQVKALIAQFGLQFAPSITRALRDVSKYLAENKATFQDWGSAIKGVIVSLTTLVKFIADHSTAFRVVAAVTTYGATEGLVGMYKGAKQIGNLSAQGNNDNLPRVIDYSRPEDNKRNDNSDGDYTSQFDEQEKARDSAAKKLQEERERQASAELGAQVNLYKTQLAEIEKIYSDSFNKIADIFKESNNPAQFQTSFDNLKTWYGSQIGQLVPFWEDLVQKQTLSETKGSFQRLQIYQETQKRKQELTQNTFNLEDKANQLLKDSQKRLTEEEIKNSQQKLELEAKLAQSAKELGFAQIDASEGSLARLKDYYDTKLSLNSNDLKTLQNSQQIEREYLVQTQQRKLEMLQVEVDLRQKIFDLVKNTSDGKSAGIDLTTAQNAIKKLESENKSELFKYDENISRNKQQNAADQAENYKQALEELNGKLTENRVLTERQKIENLLLTDSYKNLSEAEKDNLLAKAAQIDAVKSAQESYDKLRNIVGESVDAFANGGFKGLFQSIKDRFKNFLKEMITEWLTSKIFSVFSGQNIGGATGNASNQSGFGNIFQSIFGSSSSGGGLFGGSQGSGIFNAASGSTGSNLPTGALINLANGTQAVNVNGNQGGGLAGLFSGQGISSAIASGGATAAIALAQYALTTKSPIKGLLTGGLLGLAFGFINRSKERRKEEVQRTQFLNDAFTGIGDFDKLIADVNALKINPPSSALTQGDALGKTIHDQYISASNALKDKKTRNIALKDVSQVDARIAEKMAALQAAVTKAQSAAEFSNKFVATFATGGYMDGAFHAQYRDFKRRNGYLTGGIPDKDSLPSLLMPGEIVVNARQQNRIRQMSGFDAFAYAGIPNYPRAKTPVKMQTGGVFGDVSVSNGGSTSNNQTGSNNSSSNNYNIILQGVIALPDAKAWLESSDGKKQVINITREDIRDNPNGIPRDLKKAERK